MKNVLITGAYGFIGSNYLCHNVGNFDTIVVIDKVSYCSNKNNAPKSHRIHYIEQDLAEVDILQILIQYNINTIIHLAAQTHVDNSYDNFLEFVNDNIVATYKLLESCVTYNKVSRILMMSTDEVYGPSINFRMDEKSKFNPTNPYSASKASAEMVINTFKYSHQLPIIIVRCNNVYGMKQYPEKVIPKFVSQVLAGESITIHGDGSKIRDFIFVDDVCSAINVILKNGVLGEIYNIGANNPCSILSLANILSSRLGEIPNIKFVTDRPFNDNRYYIDFTKLSNLGWKQQVPWSEGLDRTIQWIRDNTNYWSSRTYTRPKTTIRCFNDSRGCLKFVNTNNVQEQFISVNNKNVIRGIHCSPYAKTITCLKGSATDYVVDISNKTYVKYNLRENDKVYVPPNFGHCFVATSDNTQLLYQLEGVYSDAKEKNYNYRDPYINLDIEWGIPFIVSDKDSITPFTQPVDYVVLGGNGFLGSYTCGLLKKLNKNFVKLDTRLEDEVLEEQLSVLKPKYVINAAGISGKPTTEWCEMNKEITRRVNYELQLKVANICKNLNIHLTVYGSGLVFEGKGVYTEESAPNLTNKYYSEIRGLLERDIKKYPNVLYLRILYPISGTGHEKCFLTKLRQRVNSIHDVLINCTVMPDMFPKIFQMIERGSVGIFNFVNGGLISPSKIISIADPDISQTVVPPDSGYAQVELSDKKLSKECKGNTEVMTALKQMISNYYST
jgi:dTDP-glucose 4,6-dehydratase